MNVFVDTYQWIWPEEVSFDGFLDTSVNADLIGSDNLTLLRLDLLYWEVTPSLHIRK
jgi:hypothetical protein